MAMHAFHQLPLEIFYEIALYLPLTKDVLAFSLSNSRICRALSTPILFKARLALQGWDVSAWKDEDNAAQSLGDLKRWMCIDHTYCRVTQLFEEAAADGHFLIATDSRTGDPVLWGTARSTIDYGQDNRDFNHHRWLGAKFKGVCQFLPAVDVFDGDRTAKWLEVLSKVLPLFVTHHRGGNVSHLMDAKYRDVLRAYARVIGDLCIIFRTGKSNGFPKRPGSKVISFYYSWFERMCFSLTALLIQCDADPVVSIFITDTSSPITTTFGVAAHQPHSIFSDAPLTLEGISERYFTAFFFQAVLCLPHFDPCSSPSYLYYSYLGDSAPVEPGIPTITASAPVGAPSSLPSSSSPSPSPSLSYMRPWLRDGLAGTPLATLSSTTGSAWAGYYTYYDIKVRDLPMYLELRTAPPLPDSGADTDPDCMHYFHGEGHDGVGPFTVSGQCNAHTGVVDAIKAYETHACKWYGMLTPFGMVGTWDLEGDEGWWWIWPREWSPTTTGQD